MCTVGRPGLEPGTLGLKVGSGASQHRLMFFKLALTCTSALTVRQRSRALAGICSHVVVTVGQLSCPFVALRPVVPRQRAESCQQPILLRTRVSIHQRRSVHAATHPGSALRRGTF